MIPLLEFVVKNFNSVTNNYDGFLNDSGSEFLLSLVTARWTFESGDGEFLKRKLIRPEKSFNLVMMHPAKLFCSRFILSFNVVAQIE